MPRRPLTLHVSALSNAEYASYTASLAEITSPTPDVDWEQVSLGVREARGWIRGRYGASVDGSVIDQILRNFCPELGPQDILSGGQFFAVLRLVCHAQSGSSVDDSLVFVQANPEPTAFSQSRAGSIKTTAAPPPPPRPTSDIISNPPQTPSLPPRTPHPLPNPFTRSQSHPAPSPSHEKSISEPPLSSNPFRLSKPTPTPPSTTSKPPPHRPLSVSSSSSTSSTSTRQYAYVSPPLPPRKPSIAALLPPPRHASLATPASKPRANISLHSPKPSLASFSIASPPLPPPPKPPKPPQATSPLIKQSIQAAKGAQSVKVLMDGLSKERRLEVLKKSGSGMNSGNDVSSSGAHGGSTNENTTPRRSPSPQHSYYDVALARLERNVFPSPSPSPPLSPAEGAPTKPFPFAHKVTPETPLSTTPSSTFPSPSLPSTFSDPSTSLSNPRRSKSLHHPSPASTLTSPPVPPPRRRRPESVQINSNSSNMSPFSDEHGRVRLRGGQTDTHARIASASKLEPSPFPRHLSFSASEGAGPGTGSGTGSVVDTLQRTIATLRPGPGFENARAGFESALVRVEGRVLPSGYVKGLAKGTQRDEGVPLVDDVDGSADDDDDGGVWGRARDRQRLGWDRNGDVDGAGMDDGERSGDELRGGVERDELKMPVRPGDGWRALG